jgi:hypothetical protein
MIYETLGFLAKELNKYYNYKLITTSDPRVVIGNVARAFDPGLTSEKSMEDKAVLSLVNIEEDRAAKRPENYRKKEATAVYANPPIPLNLYVLFSVTKDAYKDSLILLGLAIQYFQAHTTFTPETYPDLDGRIERITVEMYTMNFEQVNHLWGTLGGKYLPSVLFKVRQIQIDDGSVERETGLIREIRINDKMKPAVS